MSTSVALVFAGIIALVTGHWVIALVCFVIAASV